MTDMNPQPEIQKETANNRGKKKIALGVLAAIVVIGGIALSYYLRYKSTRISTEDAYIEGRIHTISSKVQGTVMNVPVSDNQIVGKGDLLVELETSDYDVAVSEAASAANAELSKLGEIKAGIEVIKRQISELRSGMEVIKADIELKEARLKKSKEDLGRAEILHESEALSKERYDEAKTGYDVAAAQLKAARKQLKQAESSVETQKALVKQREQALGTQEAIAAQKESALASAELRKSYTKVYSQADGYITRKSVEAGNQITPGRPLMAVVSLEDIWVVANYKETQLEKIKPGQRVKIEVDTYPGKVFYGRVDSIMAGTGSAFSLFPPENATGNYVKVVQRIPVKITFDKGSDKDHILRVGMSVVPTVMIEK